MQNIFIVENEDPFSSNLKNDWDDEDTSNTIDYNNYVFDLSDDDKKVYTIADMESKRIDKIDKVEIFGVII